LSHSTSPCNIMFLQRIISMCTNVPYYRSSFKTELHPLHLPFWYLLPLQQNCLKNSLYSLLLLLHILFFPNPSL
jgi:hypothetical protein